MTAADQNEDALDAEDTMADDIELTMVDPELDGADPHDRIDGLVGGDAPKYARVRQLGKGAMGDVFEIKDSMLRRRAALKEIKASMAQHPQMLTRFITEAQITAQLDHPNIVPIYDIEQRADGSLAYSMKMVRGRELKELLDEVRKRIADGTPLEEHQELEARLEIFLKLCDAVAFAHARSVVHRDLKPANVMIGAFGEVYLMDWGISRRMGAAADNQLDESVELGGLDGAQENPELTQAGQAIGTPRYMSPEQAMGRNSELDGRSDQFSLGLILFEIVSLRRAVGGRTTMDAITAVLAARKQPLIHIDDKTPIPVELRSIVDKATARQPETRYASVHELADDVRRFLADKAVLAQPDSAVQSLLRTVRRNAARSAMLAMLVLLVFAGMTIWSLDARRKAILASAQADKIAQLREKRLSAFQTRVAARSHAIDSWLVRYEERANGLAAVAAERLDHAQGVEGKVFDHQAYRTAETAPKDMRVEEIYGKAVSVSTPVYKVAPGVDDAAVQPLARKLWPMWRRMRQTLIDCRTDKASRPASEKEISALLRGGVPLRWVYVGLNEGVMFSFPGKTYDDRYDPRARPWFKEHIQKAAAGWGSPHVDSHTKQLTLTCAAPVIDRAGKRRGVLGMDVTFDYLISTLMSLEGQAGTRETYLLDNDGLVVVASSDRGRKLAEIELRPFPDAAVGALVASGSSGLRISGKEVFAFYGLRSIGWTFVVRADLEAVLSDGSVAR